MGGYGHVHLQTRCSLKCLQSEFVDATRTLARGIDSQGGTFGFHGLYLFFSQRPCRFVPFYRFWGSSKKSQTWQDVHSAATIAARVAQAFYRL
jgi:hypothetical protein